MFSYNVQQSVELKHFIFNSCIHDSSILQIEYDYEKSRLCFLLKNNSENIKIIIHFSGVTFFASSAYNEWGDNNDILSFSLEDNNAFFSKCHQKKLPREVEMLFVFQTFSGNELYVLCEEISFEIS